MVPWAWREGTPGPGRFQGGVVAPAGGRERVGRVELGQRLDALDDPVREIAEELFVTEHAGHARELAAAAENGVIFFRDRKTACLFGMVTHRNDKGCKIGAQVEVSGKLIKNKFLPDTYDIDRGSKPAAETLSCK